MLKMYDCGCEEHLEGVSMSHGVTIITAPDQSLPPELAVTIKATGEKGVRGYVGLNHAQAEMLVVQLFGALGEDGRNRIHDIILKGLSKAGRIHVLKVLMPQLMKETLDAL